MYKETLQHCIQQKNLQAFYPPNDPRLDEAADIAASHIREVCARWNIPEKQGLVLAKLALFDVVLYIDNSASMSFEEGGRRIKELKKVADCVVDIVRLFDSDGFDVRFMNGTCVSSSLSCVSKVHYRRSTNSRSVVPKFPKSAKCTKYIFRHFCALQTAKHVTLSFTRA